MATPPVSVGGACAGSAWSISLEWIYQLCDLHFAHCLALAGDVARLLATASPFRESRTGVGLWTANLVWPGSGNLDLDVQPCGL
jgi:hypothetical protein